MNQRLRLDESGTTLVEVALAAALLLAISAALVSVMVSFSSAEQEIGARIDGAATVASALDEIASDLSAANGLLAGAPSATMDSALGFSLPERDESRQIWIERDEDGHLTRRTVDRMGERSTRLLAGGSPIDDLSFSYATASGVSLVPGIDAAHVIARCAALVNVSVELTHDGARSQGQRTVALRNADPGVEPC
ncbi:MAG: hypothetical protein R2696_10840 [Microthrixaceae bacterium]